MILLISDYKYPNGDAGSVRFHNFALTLKGLGYSTFVIGNGAITKEIEYHESIPFVSLRMPNRYLSYFSFSINVLKYLKKLHKQNNIDAIIVGHVNIDTLLLLKYYCRRFGIKLIVDVVEWYSKFQFKHGKYSYGYIEKNIVNSKIISSPDRVIAISRYLESYYKIKGIKTIRIPIYMRQSECNVNYKKDFSKIIFTYAGQLGKKDYLWLMLKSFSALPNTTNKNYEFRILGATLEQVKHLCLKYNIDYHSIKNNIVAEGRVSRDRVLEVYQFAHYSFLLRNCEERYAKAGFPSKIIESITYGVPPVLNLSSDLELYLKNEQNCFISKDLTIESLTDTISRALNIYVEDYIKLAQNAKTTAEKFFDVSTYAQELLTILE